MEDARAVERAQKQAGLSQKALAERLGKSAAYVRDTCGCCASGPGAGGGRRRPDFGLGGQSIERIDKVSADVAEACVALIQAGHADAAGFRARARPHGGR